MARFWHASVCLDSFRRTGRRIKHRDLPIRAEVLFYGADGVSFHGSDGSQLTARYSELAAVLCYPDGALQLISSEAASLMIEPTLWPSGQGICNEILEHVPQQLRIDQGSRPAEASPCPPRRHGNDFVRTLKSPLP